MSHIEASFFLDFDIFLSLLKLICDKIKENFYENIEEKSDIIFEKTQSKMGKTAPKTKRKTSE